MPSKLDRQLQQPTSRNLVFTSAGDHANLRGWLSGRRDFDLWITYYGDRENPYLDCSDYAMVRKGGKFPNLHHAYQNYRSILSRYDSIFVMDDDLLIDGNAISRLFEVRRRYDLWLLQPAFDPRGKISHRITRARPFRTLRYANFVEVTCPLFRADKLDAFLQQYDPSLIGWGVDWWFCESLGPAIERRVAIVDAITCLNPHDATKSGRREIDQLQDVPGRMQSWQRIKQAYHLNYDQRPQTVFATVPAPWTPRTLAHSLKLAACGLARASKKPARFWRKRIAPRLFGACAPGM